MSDPNLVWVNADLLDLSSHESLMEKFKPTHCAQLAWHLPPQKFWHATENLDWVNASIHLFRSFCESGGKVFMRAGSITEYDWFSGRLDEASTPLNPGSLYSQSKKSLHEFLRVIRNVHYRDTVIIWPRLAYFFGLGEPRQKLISQIIDSLNAGQPLTIASLDIRRPYAHVSYVGKILAHALLNQTNDLVFNVSVATSYSFGQIVDFNHCLDKHAKASNSRHFF